MKYRTSVLLVLATLLILGSASAFAATIQSTVQLQAASATDLVSTGVTPIATDKAMIPGASRDAVTFTYPLAADSQIAAQPTPFLAASREYFAEVTGAELHRGTNIFVTAPNALIRLQPVASASPGGEIASDEIASDEIAGDEVAIDPTSLVIESAAGRLPIDVATKQLATADQLKAAGAPFAPGTSAFRLTEDVGVGTVVIRAPELEPSNDKYLIHVFEVDSDIELSLQAERVDYLHGDLLHISAALTGTNGRLRTSQVDGYVSSPDGRVWPLALTTTGSGIQGRLQLDATAPAEGLWQVHLGATGERNGLQVVRNVRTAFAAHLPTASLIGDVSVDRDRQLTMSFGVEVGSEGRYEVRGMLYGTDRQGQLRPIAIGHGADWLTPGNAQLAIEFDLQMIKASGLGAPFAVRDLRLLDQGRMGLLHRQSEALLIGR